MIDSAHYILVLRRLLADKQEDAAHNVSSSLGKEVHALWGEQIVALKWAIEACESAGLLCIVMDKILANAVDIEQRSIELSDDVERALAKFSPPSEWLSVALRTIRRSKSDRRRTERRAEDRGLK